MSEDSGRIRVVEVVPIQRGISRDTLSYFTKEDFAVGAFVRIPLRSSSVLGIVINVADAREAKAALKVARFQLKKLEQVEEAGTLSKHFSDAARETAYYFGATFGSMLGALLPKLVLESPELLPKQVWGVEGESQAPLVIQLPPEDRVREYKGIIRERFARGESVILCLPTHEDALRAEDAFSLGIAQYVFCTARKSKKGLTELLNRAYEEEHPILFITTPSFLFFERADLSTIILERENSRAYHSPKRPYFHVETFLKIYARRAKKTLILGDTVLSLETLQDTLEDGYSEFTPLTWRADAHAKFKLVDMRRKNLLRDFETQSDFKVFSKQLIILLNKAVEDRRKIFLFGTRKGVASSTVCGHCGSLLTCENCGSPMVLHKKRGPDGKVEPLYMCHRCTAKRDALTTCDNCGSWKLIPLGIGVDRIEEEVRAMYPTSPIFVLDKDHAPTRKAAMAIARDFALTKGGILIGTELALLYLEKIPFSAVVSLDSLFSIPDFSINERVFYLLTHLHALTEFEMLVQTRRPKDPVLIEAEGGNIIDFYRREAKERKELFYPPFALFVKVSTTDTPERLRRKAVVLADMFKDYNPDFMEVRVGSAERTLSMIMRFERNEWPKTDILDKLLLLPPEFLIKVDPDSIL